MAWLQIHQTIKDHRKTYDSADYLHIPPAHMIGLLVNFWLWALDNTPTGSLDGITNRTIARAAGWPEENADKLAESLEAAGWLDCDEEGNRAIHDWYDYAGKLIEQREAEKQRSRRRRAQAAEETTDGRPTDDRKATAGRVDKSRVDKSREDNKENTPPTPQVEREPDLQERRFAEFWQLYPKKVGKAAAQKSWKRLKVNGELHEKIMQAVARAKTSTQWLRDNGRFIPNPATWLNQGRWDDELEQATPGSSQPARPVGRVDTMKVLKQIYDEEVNGDDQSGDGSDGGPNYFGIS